MSIHISSWPCLPDIPSLDHKVELQFIARRLTSDMCKDLNQNNNQKMRSFIDFINDQDRLVNVERFVNIAKGGKFRDPPTKFGDGTSNKTAFGVAKYLGLIKADARVASKAIDQKMESLLNSKVKGFSNFEKDYISALDEAIKRSNAEAPKLADDDAVKKRRADNKAKAAAKKAQKQQPPKTAGTKRPAPGGAASSTVKKTKVTGPRPQAKPVIRKPKKP
ncbi:hypothetical protein VNI00_017366 [Paramarasmius palmivorus]|uniref:Uncharacterized protein n=1 Tax=Paramarasmius palmivorus TaxID=297713 RepID=A0AAW0B5H3_9AGAR